MVGPQPFLDFHARLVQAVPDLAVVVEEALSEGDCVVVRWLASGTHDGPFEGKPATGLPVQFRGMTWILYQDGKMVEGWDAWDVGGLTNKLAGERSA
jgi:steroid delta-isomerase-like uncharacterized protein